MNQAQQPEAPKQLDPEKDCNKLVVKINDIDADFIAKELQRGEMLKKQIDAATNASIEHFVVVTAKKRNIQFDANKFVGVVLDTKGKSANILTLK